MTLIQPEIKLPKTYDSWRIYEVDYPKFRIPIHSTFDGLKIIPEFDIHFLSKNGIINPTKKDYFYDIIFLKNFGKCTVLKGLKDPTREFNILCILFDNNVYWLYLSHEEYSDFLLKFNENENISNVNDLCNPLKIGKIYRIKENFGLNLYKDYKISVSKYEPSDHFYHKSIIGIDKIDSLKENDEFLVLEQQHLLNNINELEQQNTSFTGRYSIFADNLYYILGIGREFLGYLGINILGTKNNLFEEITV